MAYLQAGAFHVKLRTVVRSPWYFFAIKCRHCLEPPCKDCHSKAMSRMVRLRMQRPRAVTYTDKAKEAPFEDVRASCPYDIPRQTADKRLVKCTMCIDRVSNGLLPLASRFARLGP